MNSNLYSLYRTKCPIQYLRMTFCVYCMYICVFRCETRPGPQFILRSYTFHPDNVFQLLQFRYNDESCSLIGYTVKIVGSYRIKNSSSPSSSSLFVNETKLSYDIKQVTVIVHDIYWTKNLSRTLRDSCKSYTSDTPYWTPFVEYHLPVRIHKKSNGNVEAINGIAGHDYNNTSSTKREYLY